MALVFRLTAHYGNAWIGIISIAVSVFLIRTVLLLVFRGIHFRYYSVLVSLAVLALLSAYSLYNGTRRPVIREVEIETGKLPGSAHGFTIVQLSDLHLNPLKSGRWLKGIVEETNRLNPDIVVITGDLLDAVGYGCGLRGAHLSSAPRRRCRAPG